MTGIDPPPMHVDDRDGLPRPSQYDLILLVIPVAFVASVVVAEMAGGPYRLALPAAAGVGALAVVDGLFRNPPRPRAGTGRA